MNRSQFTERLDEVINDEVNRTDACLDIRRTVEIIGLLQREEILAEYDVLSVLSKIFTENDPFGDDETLAQQGLLVKAPSCVKSSCDELVAREYFIGNRNPDKTPLAQEINMALRVYFENHPFLDYGSDPVAAVIGDWDAATRFCYQRSTNSSNAFVKKDDTIIMKAALDLLPYLFERRAELPGLELLELNNPEYVGKWLGCNPPKAIKAESKVSGEVWLAVLIGSTPVDYRTIPHIEQKYQAVLKK